MAERYCGAQWIFPVTFHGVVSARTVNVTCTCGLRPGHEGKHAGWLNGQVAGRLRKALVEF